MLNKRLLIKNLLASNDENSFYDKKAQLNLDSREGKAKFLKHICALANSNLSNNSFIIIGVEDETDKIKGVDFFDDSKIQNLINAFLEHPPLVLYENVPFPKLPRYKVVGLVTIKSSGKATFLKKGIWKYKKNTLFVRQGSNSIQTEKISNQTNNTAVVDRIEKNAANNIKLVLDGVMEFMNKHSKELNPQYIVFKEQFILCWAGLKKKAGDTTMYSRVDIELINEQVKLFYSTLDEVTINFNTSAFIITEYVHLGIEKKRINQRAYPLEKTVINFKNNGQYDIVTELLFDPPQFDKAVLKHIFNSNNAVLKKLEKGVSLNKTDYEILVELPKTYLICSLNGFIDAQQKLQTAKPLLKNLTDKTPYIHLKETLRLLRKIKYN
ncbi:MAG: AAA family ATPase [Flavobacteriales bacterium]|nr:MAG: AAA family ATPase [Flavobacteriales bacterium]